MGNSNWKIWNPSKYNHGKYLEKLELTESQNGLVIKVESDRHIFSFIYDHLECGNYVEAFRFVDEMKGSYLLKELSLAREKYLEESNKKWYLYKSTNSDFINWYNNLPGPGTDIYNIEHQVILTSETTFEILSKYEPKIIVEYKK
ncbi:hypothetical protein [Aquibacillus rhizosphaerae]|uniref:Uncharacterized protein n=1 Tax=Aquibacillus rhizosphaerae TaxID=3051431 RepID=A0ABT7L5S0_9BACI|nr:hypothetical protein [Aquibacillus sp. LR5S19]MDL4840545.1 hypothetical protein [Aquibacillus sp. LR5S19]